jgi:DNA polymerase-1
VASRILLIDGNSLIHRAYHALPSLSSASGQPTNAAFGFLQMILALLETEQPGVAVVCLDAPGPTFRHLQYDQYKAHRAETEPDLIAQFEIIHELCDALGLTTTQLPGWEADDIIGALATRAAADERDVLIVSSDRDELQLIGPHVQLLAPIKGMSQTKTYDDAVVLEEYGVPPSAIADLKGLAGDSSDNIPGVPKVGPKTARDLLQQFGSVEALYADLSRVEKPALRERLAEFEEQARLSRHLATIATDAPVEPSLLERPWPGLDVPRLRKLMGELGFLSLLSRLPAVEDSRPAEVAASPESLEDACAQARGAKVVGVAVVGEGGGAVTVALGLPDDRAISTHLAPEAATGGLFADAPATAIPDCLRNLLADPAVPKVGHDLKGQAALLQPLGLNVEGFGFDTDVAAYLIAPHRSDRDLPALMAQHFGEALPPDEEPARRASAAARGVLRLRPALTEQLEQVGARGLFDDMEMPLAVILRDMERTGIAVDLERLDEIGDRLGGMMLAVSQRAYHLGGGEFNLESPKQIAEVLFERLQLPRGKRTKTGWSTNADVLEELAPDHEIVALILQHREYAKLRSTYVEALKRLISPDDGRVHTTFEQTVTATGRLSSRNPNLQNIPIRTDGGREIRSCFVAQGTGNVLLAADYSQIELRIMAHFSQDQSLLEAFRSGQDIHARTASEIFGMPLDAVTADMRRAAKTINYAVIYGMGAQALARQLSIKRTDAQKFIDEYFAHLPGVREYMTGTVERARTEGFVATLFGRRRPMPDLLSSDPRTRAYAERAAANAPLQGTAADIIKIAMVQLAERLAPWPACRLLLQVHDELVFEIPEDIVPQVAPVVREVMCGAANLDVPLEVEPKAGPNWRDMEPV